GSQYTQLHSDGSFGCTHTPMQSAVELQGSCVVPQTPSLHAPRKQVLAALGSHISPSSTRPLPQVCRSVSVCVTMFVLKPWLSSPRPKARAWMTTGKDVNWVVGSCVYCERRQSITWADSTGTSCTKATFDCPLLDGMFTLPTGSTRVPV